MAGKDEADKSNLLRLVRDPDIVPLTGVSASTETLEKVLEHLQKNDPGFEYDFYLKPGMKEQSDRKGNVV